MVLSGCSSNTGPAPSTTSAAPTTSSAQAAAPTPPLLPGGVEVSPGGVTTAVGAPAESTEDGYFRACQAARTWIQQQGGDPKSQIEPFLKMVQTGGPVGPATFDKPWAQLSQGQQSAVIVAVQAAADDLCG
ncbi:hypothetical protein Mycch_4098 [Mycolicibacterium chubuense NBB4]|uniref:LpqV protein n=1 Tax=Mycolicibacterium chubuense (strain NBB4) TaxID=710421 RepID=I4BNG3_MYCCN|nr:hypothetical protein Mycch_4098 [Mycolicibacterium chubuense NBB4]